MQARKQGKSRRRKAATIISILLVIAMLLTGTFAWQSISQQALNQTIGLAAPAGGRLHNDQQVMGERFGTREWSSGLTANHDVYVENFEGDEDTAETPAFEGRPIFARVRLYEYMEIGTGANLRIGEYGYDTRLAPDGGRVQPVVRYAPDGETLTDRDDPSTWTPFIPGNEQSDLFRQYWSWSFGGQKYYMPTFNRDPMSRMSDVKGDAWDPQHAAFEAGGEPANPTMRIPDASGVETNPNAFPPLAGTDDFFAPAGSTHEAPVKRWVEIPATGEGSHELLGAATHTSRLTLDAEFLTMAQWTELPEEERVRPAWVMDVDGWAYWSQPIQPNTATGLLLDNVTLSERPQEEWFYDIFVNAEFATAEEWHQDSQGRGWFHDELKAPSPGGIALMSLITGQSGDFENPAAALEIGATFTDSRDMEWRVLTTNENGARLIISQHVHGLGMPFNNDNTFTPLHDGATLRATMDSWFHMILAPEIRINAVLAEGTDEDIRTTATGFNAAERGNVGFTHSGSATATNNPNSMFLLSISEINRYLDTVALRQATIPGGGNANWWTRSPGGADETPIARVSSAGTVEQANATLTDTGFRPAMWLGGNDLAENGMFTDSNGILWRIVAQQADGTRLIITDRVFSTPNAHESGSGVRYHSSNLGSWTALSGAEIRTSANGLNNWFNNNVATSNLADRTLEAVRRNTDVRTGANASGHTGENATAGRTTPGAPTTVPEQALFIFSISEANNHLGTNNADRTAMCVAGTARIHWTRSIGGTTTTAATRQGTIIASGAHGGSNMTTTDRWFRPAMWIGPAS